MILQALNQYYDRLAADPKQNIAPFGFSRQKISFCIVVEPDGTLASFQPVVSEVVKGKPLPENLIAPGQAKPPGAGLNPCFLWDNVTYLLGVVPEGREAEWAEKRFEAFRDRHLAVEKEISDEAFSSVCRFLKRWQPSQVADHPELADMTKNFGAFRIRGREGYVHDRPAVQEWWRKQTANQSEGEIGRCLVTNETLPLARLHEPKIKGVRDAQSSGALLISFNLDAFESYGKTQSYNSPVSEKAAFQYATALNRLLDDMDRRAQIGDATTVFWTETPTPAEKIVSPFLGGYIPPAQEGEDNELLAALKAFLDCLRKGKRDELASQLGTPETKYFILGLSPNASRISVRFWLSGTLGELGTGLARHIRELDIVGLPDERPPTLRDLLRETAREAKDIPPLLEGGLTRAILMDTDYPQAFYQAILRRIGADRRITPNRAAAIKVVLIRNYGKEIPMSLDVNRPEAAYHLGRWFALLEKIQRDQPGSEKLNTTIKDRFYTCASATPAAVFPRLIQLSQHHLRKIENPGLRITREKQTQEIADRLNVFPRRLNLEDQGLFHLGYYHQNRDLYTKKEEPKE
ncbi:MAG: type I-C CRISPR-associated protein Cas8c/Csd1 [Phycisphaerae bacterium]|nr:type I-C CRISPR-associated protein Cas8c/Csd1 [Phycisphaerae bacterium]